MIVMRVLSADPGYGRCGVAVLEKGPSGTEILHSMCVETSSDQEFPQRLARVIEVFEQWGTEYHPQSVALERLYLAKNKKTAMRVAEVRGALISSAIKQQIPIFEYTPGEVKVAVTGYGNADKKAMTKMIHALFKKLPPLRHDDEYDAIAVGLTHLARTQSMVKALQ
jgi:crossover junction endodeoxyribonuclease RuvC